MKAAPYIIAWAVFALLTIAGGYEFYKHSSGGNDAPLAVVSPTITDAEARAEAQRASDASVHAQETAAALSPPTPVAPTYKLALISGTCTQQSDIGFNRCQGFVKNVSGVSLENVEVVIEWVDSSGIPQSSDDALIDYNPVLSGQESPWNTIGTYNPALRRFRVMFKDLLGGTILTRDDRQQ
jgi:hypothetical protein